MSRSNPVLDLPAMHALRSLDQPTRASLVGLLGQLRLQMLEKAAESHRKNKWMMFAYWRVAAVYTVHIIRALRHGETGRSHV